MDIRDEFLEEYKAKLREILEDYKKKEAHLLRRMDDESGEDTIRSFLGEEQTSQENPAGKVRRKSAMEAERRSAGGRRPSRRPLVSVRANDLQRKNTDGAHKSSTASVPRRALGNRISSGDAEESLREYNEDTQATHAGSDSDKENFGGHKAQNIQTKPIGCKKDTGVHDPPEAPQGATQELPDETVYLDATTDTRTPREQQPQSNTPVVLVPYRKRAIRRLGRRLRKRPYAENDDLGCVSHKRQKTEVTESYLIQYCKKQQEKRARLRKTCHGDSSTGLSTKSIVLWEGDRAQSADLLDLKGKLIEKEKEVAMLAEDARLAKEALEREKKAEVERLLAETKAREAELAEKERFIRELEEKTKRLELENQKIKESKMSQSNLLAPEAMEVANRRARNEARSELRKPAQAPKCDAKSANAQTSELKSLISKAREPKMQSVNDFFQSAKKDYVEKLNQTIISKTALLKNSGSIGESASPAKEPAAPRETTDPPHELYKKKINSLANQEKARVHAKLMSYVPKTEVPFYTNEEEFEGGEKAFKAPPYAMDPKLPYYVRKQDHARIREFFGSDPELDVESIFKHIQSVSNWSPNKFARNG